MRPFLSVFAFVIVSFAMLAASISYSNPDFTLRPLLYVARFAAWVVALSISTLLFLPAFIRRSIQANGATLFAALSILIFYPCDGFFRAHAEERVIRHKIAHRDPHDDMGPHYLYGSFSPGTGGSSRGAMDAAEHAWRGLTGSLCFAFLWLPFVFIISRLAFRRPTSTADAHNA